MKVKLLNSGGYAGLSAATPAIVDATRHPHWSDCVFISGTAINALEGVEPYSFRNGIEYFFTSSEFEVVSE